MNLHDEFEVPLGVTEAWAVLTDLEKITPCLPGIWLSAVAGDEYQGVVKVKVGPLTASYEGVARYLLLDADTHKAVLKAEGHEIRGPGKGTALVTATLSPSADGTSVQVVTVLSIDGKLAHLPNGALAAVSRNLITEFAENLQMILLAVPEAILTSPVVRTPTEDEQAAVEEPAENFTEVSTDAEPPVAETEVSTDAEPPVAETEVSTDAEPPVAEMDYGQIYPSNAEPEEERESLMRRLAPYLTVAGFLLIARIAVYWFRRRPR